MVYSLGEAKKTHSMINNGLSQLYNNFTQSNFNNTTQQEISQLNNKKLLINEKYVRYGEYIYHTQYSTPRVIDSLYTWSNNRNPNKKERTQEEIQQSIQASSQNSKRKLKALLLCNIPYGNTKFLTLTYRTPQFNETQAKLDFKNFIKRLRYHTKTKIRYIAVHEEHDSALTQTERAHSYHFHVLISDLDYISAKVYADIWKHGFIKINRVKGDTFKMSAYITKYLTKQTTHNKFQRRFLYSKNCYRPRHITVQEVPLLVYEYTRRYNNWTGGTARCDIYKIAS